MQRLHENALNDLLKKSELQKNLSINPNHAFSLRMLADIFESEGDHQSARSYRERVMEIWENADHDFKPLRRLREKLNSSVAVLIE